MFAGNPELLDLVVTLDLLKRCGGWVEGSGGRCQYDAGRKAVTVLAGPQKVIHAITNLITSFMARQGGLVTCGTFLRTG